jgi:hypothetical protein
MFLLRVIDVRGFSKKQNTERRERSLPPPRRCRFSKTGTPGRTLTSFIALSFFPRRTMSAPQANNNTPAAEASADASAGSNTDSRRRRSNPRPKKQATVAADALGAAAPATVAAAPAAVAAAASASRGGRGGGASSAPAQVHSRIIVYLQIQQSPAK